MHSIIFFNVHFEGTKHHHLNFSLKSKHKDIPRQIHYHMQHQYCLFKLEFEMNTYWLDESQKIYVFLRE